MNRNFFRFSIAGLLFVGAGTAGTLAGYRVGFRQGYSSGEEQRRSEKSVARVYSVGDLLRQADEAHPSVGDPLDFQLLLDATQTSVAPSEWESLGGPSTMTPIPWMEALVIHATPSVHHQVTTFFDDLSALQAAVDRSRQEQDEMELARQNWINGILNPIAVQLNTELTPIPHDFELLGTWQMNQDANGSSSTALSYTFLDQTSVKIAASESNQSPKQTWYSSSPGSLVIEGQAFIAATTMKRELILVYHNQTGSFLIGNEVGGPLKSNGQPE